MNKLNTPDQFKSRPAMLLMAVVGLFLAYLLGSLAFDTGSWWHYLGTLFLLVFSTHLITQGTKSKK